MKTLSISVQRCKCRFNKAFMRQNLLRCILQQVSCAACCLHGAFPVHVSAGQATRLTCHDFHSAQPQCKTGIVMSMCILTSEKGRKHKKFPLLFQPHNLQEQHMVNHGMFSICWFAYLQTVLSSLYYFWGTPGQFQAELHRRVGISKPIRFLQCLGRQVTRQVVASRQERGLLENHPNQEDGFN